MHVRRRYHRSEAHARRLDPRRRAALECGACSRDGVGGGTGCELFPHPAHPKAAASCRTPMLRDNCCGVAGCNRRGGCAKRAPEMRVSSPGSPAPSTVPLSPRSAQPDPAMARDADELLLVVVDARGDVEQMNAACQHATGWRLDDLRGRPVWETLFAPANAPAARVAVANPPCAAGERLGEWLRRDGGRLVVTWSIAPLPGCPASRRGRRARRHRLPRRRYPAARKRGHPPHPGTDHHRRDLHSSRRAALLRQPGRRGADGIQRVPSCSRMDFWCLVHDVDARGRARTGRRAAARRDGAGAQRSEDRHQERRTPLGGVRRRGDPTPRRHGGRRDRVRRHRAPARPGRAARSRAPLPGADRAQLRRRLGGRDRRQVDLRRSVGHARPRPCAAAISRDAPSSSSCTTTTAPSCGRACARRWPGPVIPSRCSIACATPTARGAGWRASAPTCCTSRWSPASSPTCATSPTGAAPRTCCARASSASRSPSTAPRTASGIGTCRPTSSTRRRACARSSKIGPDETPRTADLFGAARPSGRPAAAPRGLARTRGAAPTPTTRWSIACAPPTAPIAGCWRAAPPCATPNGRPYRLVGSLTDITSRKRAEEDARQRQAELAHVLRVSAMGEMAAGLAHELNQPLAGDRQLRARLRTALGGYRRRGRPARERSIALPPKPCAPATSCAASSASSARSRRATARSTSTTVARDAVALVRAEAAERDIAPPTRARSRICPACAPIASRSSRSSSTCCATPSTPSRNAPGVVCLRTSLADGRAVVAISDTGDGIPPELRERVFAPFFTTKTSGLGMGLSISRTIIEAHGGRLRRRRERRRGHDLLVHLATERRDRGSDQYRQQLISPSPAQLWSAVACHRFGVGGGLGKRLLTALRQPQSGSKLPHSKAALRAASSAS